LVGLLQLTLSIFASGVNAGDQSPGYRTGYILGGAVLAPLLVIALFSIGRRFRNLRSYFTILLVLWGLGCLGSISSFSDNVRKRQEAQADQQAMAEMEQKILALQRQAATATGSERIQLAQQARQAMEDALPKLSAENRAGLLVGLKLVNPIIEDGSAYLQELTAFQQSPEWDLSTARTQEEIRARIAKIDRLAAGGAAMHQRIANLDVEAARLLQGEKIDARTKAGILRGVREAAERKLRPISAIRQTQQKSFDKYKEALKLLHARWGHWNTKEGVIVWDDQAGLTEFNAIIAAFDAIQAEQIALQKKYFLEQ
jgi:hypothetical protein